MLWVVLGVDVNKTKWFIGERIVQIQKSFERRRQVIFLPYHFQFTCIFRSKQQYVGLIDANYPGHSLEMLCYLNARYTHMSKVHGEFVIQIVFFRREHI